MEKRFSYYLGVKLQNTAISATEADNRFASTCNLCDCRFPCQTCGINAAHNEALYRITASETAKLSAALDDAQKIIENPLTAEIDEAIAAFEAAFGKENAERLLNEVYGCGGLVDLYIGIGDE